MRIMHSYTEQYALKYFNFVKPRKFVHFIYIHVHTCSHIYSHTCCCFFRIETAFVAVVTSLRIDNPLLSSGMVIVENGAFSILCGVLPRT